MSVLIVIELELEMQCKTANTKTIPTTKQNAHIIQIQAVYKRKILLTHDLLISRDRDRIHPLLLKYRKFKAPRKLITHYGYRAVPIFY